LRARAAHQFLATFLPRDATGLHALGVRRCLREAGWRSEIFAEAVHDDLASEAHHFREYSRLAEDGDLLIYQMTTATALAGFLASRNEALIVDYHNITPPELYDAWEPAVAQRNRYALDELASLADRSAYGVGDSELNCRDLRALGYERTRVLPLFIDMDRRFAWPDPGALRELEVLKSRGGSDLVFIGRLAPNKAQHDLVQALWVYRRLYDPRARLWLVGQPSCSPYAAALREMVAHLGLASAVHFRRGASDALLAAYYLSADLFVCASDHEGFCMPILEAMHHRLPVVAYSSSAVPETVQDAGVLIQDKSPVALAAAFDAACRRREQLVDDLEPAVRSRLAAFDTRAVSEQLLSLVAEVAGRVPG
jgi:glycosyltransferase involved in cell wall biosynthesis